MDPSQLIDDRYQIVRLLGEGGMGAVYEARHTGTGRRVAVKVIIGHHTHSEGVVARFQREARAAGAIETQHIAAVLDTGMDRATGNPYMVMEFLQGEDVQQCVKRVGPLEPNIALRVIAQACVGLQKAHETGIIHRDIKPANLFLAAQDHDQVIVKLLDFGIAKVSVDQMHNVESAALTRTGSMLGSPIYMSPEQARGAKSADARTDIWSMGVVFYEILAGLTPYSHCDTLGGLIFEICSTPPRLIQELAPWVSPEIAAIVHRALTIDVTRRYASVADMQTDVRALLPNGMTLDQSMIAPLADGRRAAVAPRLSATATGLSVSSWGPLVAAAASASGVSSGSGSGLQGEGAMASSAAGTAGGVSSSLGANKRGGRVLPIALGAGLLLCVGAFAAYRVSVSSSPPTAVSALAPIPAVSVAQTATLPAVSAALVAEMRNVKVAVLPSTASVEIDGLPAAVSAGTVTLSGAAGSVHQVRVFAGKNETTLNVVVSEAGAVPAQVVLGAKPVAAAAGNAGGAAVKPSSKTPGTPTPGAAAPATPAPAAAAPATKPANPGVDRSFQ